MSQSNSSSSAGSSAGKGKSHASNSNSNEKKQATSNEGPSYGILICIIVVSLIFLGVGLWGRQTVLNSNPCSMTMTSRDRIEVPMKHSSMSSRYKLWKYSLPRSESNLNPHPVLFLPGHLGNADQARSMSSKMHNGDEFFQYFSLDFNTSLSGMHGNEILTQAVFTNEALVQIKKMYAKSSKYKKIAGDIKVILVGHSYGGMVAKTSLLLNNHPHCAVKNIVMLSTPNQAPAYSLDASLSVLYDKVNRAWREAHYNTSRACLAARGINTNIISNTNTNANTNANGNANSGADSSKQSPDDDDEFSFDSSHKTANTAASSSSADLASQSKGLTLKAHWDCPPCVANVRVVSITGGDIDVMVPPLLTRLDAMTPVPRNRTAEVARRQQASQRSSSSLFAMGTITNWIFSVAKKAIKYSLSFALPNAHNSNTTTTNTTTNTTNDNTTNDNATLTDDSSNTTSSSSSSSSSSTSSVEMGDTSAPSTNTTTQNSTQSNNNNIQDKPRRYGAYESITTEHWEMNMADYIEPMHCSLRTSQFIFGFQKNGFPIDHKSILWCKEFISSLSQAMRKLASLDSDTSTSSSSTSASSAILESVFHLNTPTGPSEDLLSSKPYLHPQVYSFLHRSEGAVHWQNASTFDQTHINSKLNLKIPSSLFLPFVSFATNFVSSSKLSYVFMCYMATSYLSLSVPLFRTLAGYKMSLTTKNNDIYLLNPHVHTHVDIIAPATLSLLKQALGMPLYDLIASSMASPTGLVSFFVVLVGKIFYDIYIASSPTASIYVNILTWIVSYGLALAIRLLLLILIYATRSILNTVFYVINVILRFTIWNKYVRKFYRKCKRRFPKSILSMISNLYFPCVVLSAAIYLCFDARDRYFGSGITTTTTTTTTSASSQPIQLSAFLFFTSVVIITFSALLCFFLLLALIRPPERSDLYHTNTQLLLLYLPALLIALPSVITSFQFLKGDPSAYSSALPLFDIFGPERINVCYSIVMIVVHLRWAQCSEWLCDRKRVKPLLWVVELFGPVSPASVTSVDYSDDSSDDDSDDISDGGEEDEEDEDEDGDGDGEDDGQGIRLGAKKAAKRSVVCIHEDGGSQAIFESLLPSEPLAAPCAPPPSTTTTTTTTTTTPSSSIPVAQEVAPGVYLGPTYHVLSCNCMNDKSLKDVSEWCSWCRCKRCGGKHLKLPSSRAGNGNRQASNTRTSSSSSSSSSTPLEDFSASLLLLFVLLLLSVITFAYAGALPFRHGYLLGHTAAAFVMAGYLDVRAEASLKNKDKNKSKRK